MGTFIIRGWIMLPSPKQFEHAIAIVGLDDVSKTDAPSIRIAETVIEPISGLVDRIPFRLTLDPDLLGCDAYVLTAEIRQSRGRRLSPGDFLTTAAFPWAVGDCSDQVIDVSQI